MSSWWLITNPDQDPLVRFKLATARRNLASSVLFFSRQTNSASVYFSIQRPLLLPLLILLLLILLRLLTINCAMIACDSFGITAAIVSSKSNQAGATITHHRKVVLLA